jgi:hypothetical protein
MNASLFWRLFLAHLVADFTLQPDALYAMKRKVWGVALHAFIFFAVGAMLLSDIIQYYAFSISLTALVVSHGIIDWIKTRLIKKIGKDSIWLFLGDQAIHIFLIIVVSIIFSRLNIPNILYYKPLAFAIIAIWVLPVLFDLIEKELPQQVFKYSWERYSHDKLAMLERAVLFVAAAKMGWFSLGFLIIIPHLIFLLRRKNYNLGLAMVPLAIALGYIARITY